MPSIAPGTEILGTYVIERFLGQGAFAEVYRVRHRFLGRQAMKIFHGTGMTREETERVLGEAILLSTIGHPNIVRVFDANVADTPVGQRSFFTMEFVAGGSLDRFWRSYGNRFVPVETAVDILTQLCQGLALAHGGSPPIVHRDIKPQNILIGYDATGLRVKVSDFGLAKRVNPLSLMASARGTVAFKAPETFLDPSTDSCTGDVWAIGMTAYMLLTDRLPFDAVAEMDLLAGRGFDRKPLPPSRFNIDIDDTLERIVLRALSVAPDDRYPDAGAMLADLRQVTPRPWAAGHGEGGSSGDGIPSTGTDEASPTAQKTLPGSTSGPGVDAALVDEMVQRALDLGRQAATLGAAADLMEDAFNRAPGLRDRYVSRVRLWRNGVVQ